MTVCSMATILIVLLASMSSGHSQNSKEKVLILSKQFQQALFVAENSQTIYNMREVFFPSSNYRYWQPDNIEIIDIELCLKILQTESDWCQEMECNNYTQCSVYRWTNSYFLNLIDIRQLYNFELLTAGSLFGMIARGHHERLLQVTLNLTCDGLIGSRSIDDTITRQAIVQFLSWVKLYARSQELPKNWDEKDQGYVIRKYDYITVDLYRFDHLSDISFDATLTCFILFNALAMYLQLKYAPLMYTKLSALASHDDYSRSITKGFTVLIAILVPSYILGSTVIILRDPTFQLSSPCQPLDSSYYSCVPESEFATEHKRQMVSLVASATLKLTATFLYVLASIYTVKTARNPGVIFQSDCRLRWIEVYLLWSVLTAIHISIGLAGLPILIFTILMPMYLIFYVSSMIMGLGIMALPFILAFHLFNQQNEQRMGKIKLLLHSFEVIFFYLMGSGILVTLFILYYLFLTGGASMIGLKGILFSLVPPLMISVGLVIIKTKMNNKHKLTDESFEEEPLLIDI